MSALRVILPVVLGIVAAVLNFLVLRGSIAPLELTVVSKDVKADTELTEDMLEPPVGAGGQRGFQVGRAVLRTRPNAGPARHAAP